MKIVNLLYVVSMAFLFVSCLTMEPTEYDVLVYNNTERDLIVLTRWDYEFTKQYDKDSGLYGDSTLYEKVKIVEPNKRRGFYGFSDKPQNLLKSTDTLTIFILDKEEYEGKTWSQVVDSAHFRQIYYLSGDDIRLLNSKVPYPPSEAMRNMDMLPSYEEAVR